METHVLIANALVDARVCSAGTFDEALEWIRKNNPAGTENNWSKNEAESHAPMKCYEHPERMHYMFIC